MLTFGTIKPADSWSEKIQKNPEALLLDMLLDKTYEITKHQKLLNHRAH